MSRVANRAFRLGGVKAGATLGIASSNDSTARYVTPLKDAGLVEPVDASLRSPRQAYKLAPRAERHLRDSTPPLLLHQWGQSPCALGTIGPNSGSVVETDDGRAEGFNCDLWFAVFGDSSFNLRRYMKISGCECDTNEPIATERYDYFSFPQGKMYFGQGKVKGYEWAEQPTQFKEMYYAELISRSATSLSGIKGTVEVRVQLTHSDVKPSDVVPNLSKDEEGFGTENNSPYGDRSSVHPITNFKIPEGSGWQPKGIIAGISFTLVLDCDKGIRLKSRPKKTGDWALDGQNWHRAFGDGLAPRASGMAIELLP